MIRVLFQAGAVSYGYTSEMDNSDFMYEENLPSIVEMNRRNLEQSRGRVLLLPDVILSHTPPPSPLSRYYIRQFFFPEVPEDQRRGTEPQPMILDTPPTTPTTASEEGSSSGDRIRRTSTSGQVASEGESMKTGLEHTRETQQDLDQNQDLPQLSWVLRSRPHPDPGGQEEDASTSQTTQQQQQQQQHCQQAGRDLHRMADQFQADNGKLASKGGREPLLPPGVPAALTCCLSVTLLGLLCWRLLNKLR